MAVIGQYGGFAFEVRGNYVRSFKNLQIVSECDTEDKIEDAQKYVSATNGKPIQITMTITLCAYLGVDVRTDAMVLIDAAQRSYQGYFYVQSKKLFPFMLMLTRAEMKNFEIAPSGKWLSCDVSITLKQSSKNWINGNPAPSGGGSSSSGGGSGGGSGSGGGGSSSGSQKASVKKTSTTTHLPMTGVSAKSIAAVQQAHAQQNTSTAQEVSAAKKASTSKSTAAKAVSAVKSAAETVISAQKASAAQKATSAKKTSTKATNSKVRATVSKY